MVQVQSVMTPTLEAPDTDLRLQQLAAFFAQQWQTVHGRSGVDPSARLAGSTLTITLIQALSDAETVMAGNPDHASSILRQVTHEVDGFYPQLAHQIERLLHCHVGALHVELLPAASAIRVHVQLRDAPRPF